MKKLLPVLLALLVVGGLLLAGCGTTTTTTTASTPPQTTASTTPGETTASTTPAETTATTMAAEPTYYLRWAQFATAVLPDSQPQIKMAENVFNRTNGRVKIELFWSDSLVPMFEAMDAVRLGSAEMATFPFGPFGGLDPRFTSSEMPLFYNTIEAHGRSAVSPDAGLQRCVRREVQSDSYPGQVHQPTRRRVGEEARQGPR